ncbi:MAG TPA: rhodanese-like domain-containing protein [Thermoanaerobaculia bacterium]|jgi:3-mercaptopyruvate sulfurtransferase SseA|nr:rhodanese-like domain-containing protein [Thermoanaerobaculia bacterium]
MRNLTTFVVATLLTAGGSAVAQTNAPAPLTPLPAPAAIAPKPADPQESARRIEQKEAIELVKKHKAVFVDVRPKESYEQGHIKGAYSIPLGEIIGRLKELPPGKMIIPYCA